MKWAFRKYPKRKERIIQIPKYVLYNMLDHSVRTVDNLYEEKNEAILIRDYSLLEILIYTGTCSTCNNPITISRRFLAILLSDDEKKHRKVIEPIAWFNCPHCQTTQQLLESWEDRIDASKDCRNSL